MQIDENAIFNAILAEGAGPAATEEASRLAEEWIQQCLAEDLKYKVLAVETGFYIQLDSKTFVIGVEDRISEDGDGIFGSEWKTTKGATKFWTEDKWLEEITRAHQVSTYASALKYGTFCFKATPTTFACQDRMNVPFPRILVRAISKSDPPVLWPGPEGAMLSFSDEDIEATLNAYRNAAAQIRTLRRGGLLPWQYPGKQCVRFGSHDCPSLDPSDRKSCLGSNVHGLIREQDLAPALRIFTPERVAQMKFRDFPLFDTSDPASKNVMNVLKNLVDVSDEEVVILSASQLETFYTCAEQYRQISYHIGGKENSSATDTGGVFHAAVAEVGRQVMEAQKK